MATLQEKNHDSNSKSECIDSVLATASETNGTGDKKAGATEVSGDGKNAWMPRSRLWKSSDDDHCEILVYFFDDDESEKSRNKWTYKNQPITGDIIMEIAKTNWSMDDVRNSEYTPIFKLTHNIQDSHVRVTFQSGRGGSWSKLGSEAQTEGKDKPTMVLNLDDKDDFHLRATVVHEFGHALGLGHEHQRPDYWKILRKFVSEGKMMKTIGCRSIVNFQEQWVGENNPGKNFPSSQYDPDSVMHYPTYTEWLVDDKYDTPEKVDAAYEKDKITEEEYKVLKGFHKHINFVSDKPSLLDKVTLADAYYREYKKLEPSITDIATPVPSHITWKITSMCKELGTVKYKWFAIGKQLGIPYVKLKEFKKKDDPLMAAIDYLVKNNVKKVVLDWNSVVSALKSPDVGEVGLAKRLALQYCRSEQDTHARIEDASDSWYAESFAASTISSAVSELGVDDISSYFPFLSAGRIMLQLDRETTKIKARFADLIFDLFKEIEASHTFDDIVKVLKLHDQNINQILCNCKTMEEVLPQISKFWSFYDSDIIRLLTTTLGSSTAKKKFKRFIRKFHEYSSRFVSECPSDAFGAVDEEAGRVCKLKFRESVTNLTVKGLAELHNKMKVLFGCNLMRLLRCEQEGMIFNCCIEDIRNVIANKRQQFELSELGVCSIHYGEQVFDLTPDEASFDENVSDSSFSAPSSPDLSPAVSLTNLQEICNDNEVDTNPLLDVGTTEAVLDVADTESTFTVGFRTEFTDEEFQDNIGRDLDDPRLDIIDSAQTTTEHNEELHHAAKEGNLEEVKRLITKGLNPLTKNKKGDTVLHTAADYGRLDVLKYLIDKALCNPAPSGQLGITPLHTAAEAGRLSIVQYLVDNHQMDPLDQDEEGCSSLHRACHGGNLEVVKYLMEKMLQYMSIQDIFSDSTSYKTTPIHMAAMEGHIDIVKYLIKDCRCDPNLPDKKYGRGPLFMAAQKGHLSIVKFLIMECGCDPASRDTNRATPLHLAAKNGHLSTVKYLCEERKCDSLSTNNYNNTPLHNAAGLGQSDVVDYLINVMHCSPNVPGQFGRRPLHYASQEGHLHLVMNLVERHGCDPASRDDNQATPLHLAAKKGHLSTVKYLCEDRKCDPLSTDNDNNTPLYEAAHMGQSDVVDYLINVMHCSPDVPGWQGRRPLHNASQEGHLHLVMNFVEKYGCDLNTLDDNNVTPLHMAANNGYLSIIKFFTQNKVCNSICKDVDGETPLHWAAENGHLEVVKHLIEYIHSPPTIKNKLNKTPLQLALEKGHSEVVEYLLTKQ